jgi:CRP-like cAMP-binding protein
MDTKLIAYLGKSSLFKGAPEVVLAKIAAKVTLRSLTHGQTLMRKGDPSNALVIIRTGWVKVVTESGKGEEVTLNQCGPGQVLGEMSLVDRQPRSNDVITITPIEVLEIKYDDVLDIMYQHPVLAACLIGSLSERVRFANAYVEETIVWSEQIAAGNYEFVQNQVQQTQSTIVGLNLSHQARASAFLSSFFKMVEEVKEREENLKRRLEQLTIEIDEVKRQKAVKELTDTEFFENLQVAAKKLRQDRLTRLQKRASRDDSGNN